MKKIGGLFVIGFMIVACNPLNAAAGAIDYRPFFAAVKAGNVDEVQIFWETNRGMDIETKDDYGNTPLHIASEIGAIDIVRVLLGRGASIEAKNSFDCTPLHSASFMGKKECVELLLEWSADKEATDDIGAVPLHIASARGEVEVVKILLKWGANIEAKGGEREDTPLHSASFMGEKECVELLLNWGANKEAKDNNGYTAAEVAKYKGYKDIATLIESHQDLLEIKEPDLD